VAGVDGVHPRGARVEEGAREASRRGAHVEGDPSGHARPKRIERGAQLALPLQPLRRAHDDAGGGGDERIGVTDGKSVDVDPPRANGLLDAGRIYPLRFDEGSELLTSSLGHEAQIVARRRRMAT
jgi:hypothetical protein